MAGRSGSGQNATPGDDLGIVSRRAPARRAAAKAPTVATPSRYGRQVDLKREAMRLYDAGHPYHEIARSLDQATAVIRGWIETELGDYIATPETATRLKRRQLRLIEIGYRRVSAIADDYQKTDPELALKAVDRLVKLMDREAKLSGLDTPVRVETSWAGGVSEADREIAAAVAAAEAEVSRREAELSRRPDAT